MSFFKKFNNLDAKRDVVKNIFLQLGMDIDGEAIDDQFGYSVSMNNIGTRVAIGAFSNDVDGQKVNAGCVRVYELQSGGVWKQMGSDIDGEAAGDQFGFSVSINGGDGSIVAIGAPFNSIGGTKANAGQVRLYSWNGTSWTKLGNDINGEAAGDQFGFSVSLNVAGNRVAIGAPFSTAGGVGANTGQVRVLENSYGTWTSLGSRFNGSIAGSQLGFSVSLNAAGDRIAIGAPYANGVNAAKPNSGQIVLYYYQSSSWSPLNTIRGKNAGDRSGWSVSLNAAGDRVAIGAPFSSAGAAKTNAGQVSVYYNFSSFFAADQLGADINGEIAGDQFGWSVSFNAAGDMLAIGAPFSKNVGTNIGHVEIYNYGTAWIKLKANIYGEAAGDQSGWSVSMNAAGDRIAIGAPYNDGINTAKPNSGHVRVYYNYLLNNKVSIYQLGNDIDSVFGGEFAYSIAINAAGNRVVIGSRLALGNDGMVSVYELQSDTWIQLGSNLTAGNDDQFGRSVAMNAAGDRIVAGGWAASNSTGKVRAYSWTGTSWTQLGGDINGIINSQEALGYSVAMNAAGDRIAVGILLQDAGITSDAGEVRLYELRSGVWTSISSIYGSQSGSRLGNSVAINAAGDRYAGNAPFHDVGSNADAGQVRVRGYGSSLLVLLDGEVAGDQFGQSISMNAAGDIIAIGTPLNDNAGTNAGYVKVFKQIGGVFTQLGQNINGKNVGNRFGSSVSLNAAGDRLAIGAIVNQNAGRTNAGYVQIYKWDEKNWVQIGVDIIGELAGDESGGSVSMNAAGDRVAIGAIKNGGGGHVRVYQISS